MNVHIQITLKNGTSFMVKCEEKEAMEIYEGTKYIMENKSKASVEVKHDSKHLLIDANEIAMLGFPEYFLDKDKKRTF